MRRLLLGMVLGAGLASLSFTVGLQMTKSADDRFFVLSTRIGGDDQAKLIGAAGGCVGRFRAETTSHTFDISYAINDLSAADIACLIEESSPIRREIFVRGKA